MTRRLLLTSLATLACVPASAVAASDPPGRSAPPPATDPQSWVLPADMKWSDYKPIPGFNWRDPSKQPPKKLRAALVLGDFPDRQFLVTKPNGSDPAGNPTQAGGVPQAKAGDFYKDLLNTPQALNHRHTINEYWLEDSYGQLGIDMEAFGPYTMSRNEYEYGLAEYNQ